MQKLNQNVETQSRFIGTSPNITSENDSINHLSEKELGIQSFIRICIEDDLKGTAIMNLAAEKNVSLSYRSIISKIGLVREKGYDALNRSSRNDFGEVKSFDSEVLLKLQQYFIGPQCVTSAYDETHRWLRSISRAFINPHTGEEYAIYNGRLCDIKDNQLISLHTNLYEPGIYKINPPSDSTELKIGSLQSAQRYLKDIKTKYADALYVKKFGMPDYRLKGQNAMKLNYSHLMPNECWSGDNKLLNTIVISEDWKSVFRPWLSGWYDLSTRRYCYEITRNANAESISNSICNAIAQWGLPKQLNFDRGKDYRSMRVSTIVKVLGLERRLSNIKLARAKAIESFHNILDHLLEKLPGGTGKNYTQMPIETREMLKKFTKISKQYDRYMKLLFEHGEFTLNLNSEREGRIKSSKRRFMHITEFIEELDTALEKYHSRVHGGLKKDKLGKKVYNLTCQENIINKFGESMNTPNGRFDYKVAVGFKPIHVKPEVIAIFAMNFDLRIVQLKTGISFNNEDYFNSKLKPFAGDRVLIRYTNINSKTIYVFHSRSLQRINSRKHLTKEILKDLKFVAICSMVEFTDYNDPGYKDNLILQREEEKRIKSQLGHHQPTNFPHQAGVGTGMSNVTQMTGQESQVSDIKQAEMELITKKTKKKSKLKSLFDD